MEKDPGSLVNLETGKAIFILLSNDRINLCQ